MSTALSALPTFVLAQEGGGGGPLGGMLVPILIVFMIFYFLVLRPGSRDRKAREAKIRALQKGTKVVTNAGIHGTVVGVDDDTVTLKVDDKTNTRIRFSKAAIWQVVDGSGPSSPAADTSAESAS